MCAGWLQIIRGVALGLALIMYGREEGADTLIEQMTRDQDQILRHAPHTQKCVRSALFSMLLKRFGLTESRSDFMRQWYQDLRLAMQWASVRMETCTRGHVGVQCTCSHHGMGM